MQIVITKKNMKKLLLLTISIVYILTIHNSCQKGTNKICINDDSVFRIGVESCFVDVTSFDFPINIKADIHDSDRLMLDIDNDGVNDFEIVSTCSTSEGGINVTSSDIRTINTSFQLSTVEIFDTIYTCERVYNDSTFWYTYYNNASNYNCSGESSIIDYSSISYACPKIHSSLDTLTFSESWLSENLILASYDISSSYYETSIVRGVWSNQNMKYILIKKNYNGNNLFGWIKLSISGMSDIFLYEFAIQKMSNQ